MTKWIFVAVMVAMIWIESPATAGSLLPKALHCWPDCVGKFCCDDYCPKPPPCAKRVKCFRCPDYCSKYAPCPISVKRGGCPDYCRKPVPCLTCPPPCIDLQCLPSK